MSKSKEEAALAAMAEAAATLRADAASLRAEASSILDTVAAKEREAGRLELSVAEAANYARTHADQPKTEE